MASAQAELVPLISRYFGRTVSTTVPAARAAVVLPPSAVSASRVGMSLSDGDSPGFRVMAMSSGAGPMMSMSAAGGAGTAAGVRFLSMLTSAKRAPADPVMAEALSKYF